MIHQGDIYWIEFDEPVGSGPGYKHPHVVVQNDLFNGSKIRTVAVCPLTSNLKRADVAGNVVLEQSESKLPKRSVVNVSQLFTVDKTQLEEYIGTLPPKKVGEILKGINLLLEPRDLPD
ncbi:MAG TPA: type II toxin-antitoxin system PemK/MazF family toxin [Geomonas sp.]|nr:type II toxin-antitoxin system PemK/MazF family toxin [Geomonas sp.]